MNLTMSRSELKALLRADAGCAILRVLQDSNDILNEDMGQSEYHFCLSDGDLEEIYIACKLNNFDFTQMEDSLKKKFLGLCSMWLTYAHLHDYGYIGPDTNVNAMKIGDMAIVIDAPRGFHSMIGRVLIKDERGVGFADSELRLNSNSFRTLVVRIAS